MDSSNDEIDTPIYERPSNDEDAVASTLAFKNAIFLNIMIFLILMITFEISRHIKAIYFKRLNKRFEVGWFPDSLI